MRRATGLFERIAAPENLLAAFLAARRGKGDRPEVRAFAVALDANLAALRATLLEGTYRFDRYRQFPIHDPKPRTISVAPFADRVLHHAIMDVCAPVFERAQCFDSYACRPGKGTRSALERARRFATAHPFYLKLDVRKYFDSIAHARLKAMLSRQFKEPRVLALFAAAIDGYGAPGGRGGFGLPIGNLTSQYFANHYLAGLDHWIKECLRVSGYTRYMDDLVLWGPGSRVLRGWADEVAGYCEERLGLRLKEPFVNRSAAGLPFLGFVVFPDRLRLSGRSCRRARRRLRATEQALADGSIGQSAAAAAARGVLARTDWSTGMVLRRRLLAREFGHGPWARTASSAAAPGTTTPGTAAARTATGTSRRTAGTTSASGLSWPAAQGIGRMSTIEPGRDPVLSGAVVGQDEAGDGGRVSVARGDTRDEGSRPPFLQEAQ